MMCMLHMSGLTELQVVILSGNTLTTNNVSNLTNMLLVIRVAYLLILYTIKMKQERLYKAFLSNRKGRLLCCQSLHLTYVTTT